MRYYKTTDAAGTLTAIGTGSGGVEISAEEYATFSDEIGQKTALVYALADGRISAEEVREDWREEIVRRAQALNTYDAGYTQEALEAKSNAELERILYSLGVSANMTKANMVTLILAMQGGSEVELV